MFGHDLVKKFFVRKWYRYHSEYDHVAKLTLRNVFGHVWEVAFGDGFVRSGV
jgi:hypothetical protein